MCPLFTMLNYLLYYHLKENRAKQNQEFKLKKITKQEIDKNPFNLIILKKKTIPIVS